MNKPWTMTSEHAKYAESNPPREGYICGGHAETFGGGCFNCGWQPNTPNGEFAGKAQPATPEQES